MKKIENIIQVLDENRRTWDSPVTILEYHYHSLENDPGYVAWLMENGDVGDYGVLPEPFKTELEGRLAEESYIVLSYGGESILITHREKFQEMPLAEVYDRHGGQIGHVGAGDMLVITSKELAAQLNENFEGFYDGSTGNTRPWQDLDELHADQYAEEFEFAVGQDPAGFEFEPLMVLGHTYWNGHNWETWVINSLETDCHEDATELHPEEYQEILKEFCQRDMRNEHTFHASEWMKNGKYIFSKSFMYGETWYWSVEFPPER